MVQDTEQALTEIDLIAETIEQRHPPADWTERRKGWREARRTVTELMEYLRSTRPQRGRNADNRVATYACSVLPRNDPGGCSDVGQEPWMRSRITRFRISVKNRATMAFVPVSVLLVVVSSYALVEGNFGTAYRHRAQIMPLFFVFSGVGLTWIKARVISQTMWWRSRTRVLSRR